MRRVNMLFAILLVAGAVFIVINPYVSGGNGILAYTTPGLTTTSSTVSITGSPISITTQTSTTSTTTQTSSTSTSFTSTTTFSLFSYTTTLTRSFLNISVITFPYGGTLSETVTNTVATLTSTIIELTTSTITTTGATTATSTQIISLPPAIPGFPTESVLLGLLLGILALMLLRRRAEFKHRRR